jgi:hypothetical protein
MQTPPCPSSEIAFLPRGVTRRARRPAAGTWRPRGLPVPLAVPAVLALVAILAGACGQPGTAPVGSASSPPPAAPPPETAAASAPSAAPGPGPLAGTPVPGQPLTNELQPHSVQVGTAPPVPAAAPDHGQSESDMAARERHLAERLAALEARERRLRHREESAAPPASPSPGGTGAAAAAAPVPGAADGEGPSAGAAGAGDAGGPASPVAPGEAAGGGPANGDQGGEGAVEPPPWTGSPSAAAPAAAAPPAAPAVPVTVPAGANFEVSFTKGLASNSSSVGQVFRARVLSDLRLDGAVAIPAGSEVLGVVTEAVGARRIGGHAKLSVKFTDLVLPTGSTVPLHASFLEQGKSRAGRDAATIGGSIAGGALLGRILGQNGRGTVIGALVGAVVGTAIAAKSSGEEVVIPEGSVVTLKLDQPLSISAARPAER